MFGSKRAAVLHSKDNLLSYSQPLDESVTKSDGKRSSLLPKSFIMSGEMDRVTRLGKILPFGRFFMALGEFFSRKNHPMIWAEF
jgi:hypothetical protein